MCLGWMPLLLLPGCWLLPSMPAPRAPRMHQSYARAWSGGGCRLAADCDWAQPGGHDSAERRRDLRAARRGALEQRGQVLEGEGREGARSAGQGRQPSRAAGRAAAGRPAQGRAPTTSCSMQLGRGPAISSQICPLPANGSPPCCPPPPFFPPAAQVADLGSLNGTLLNGEAISVAGRKRGRDYRLSTDDILQVCLPPHSLSVDSSGLETLVTCLPACLPPSPAAS